MKIHRLRLMTQRSITFALILCLVLAIGASSAQEPPSSINANSISRAQVDDDTPVRPTINRNDLGLTRSTLDIEALGALDPDYVLPNAIVPESGPITVLVELEGAAAGSIWQSQSAANPDALVPQVASRSVSLMAQQQSLLSTMQSQFNVQTLGHITITGNALVMRIDAANLDAINALPGVARVIPDQFGELTNADSVPFIGAISAWENDTGMTGTGIRVGIIDSGVDYTHANFNGSGSSATYSSNDSSTLADIGFDGSRVVGGYDFVGDGWSAGAPLNPDDDPIDCNGHGSHVAGTAAGSGVNDNGTTYTGPYDASVTAFNLKIGPGVAPQADIYALKIGDCSSSVSFTAAAQALEFAMDPNGDLNPDDRLDVTNNSYGGFYGSPQEFLTQQFDLASQAGVVMVGSAGNEGDTFYVNGAPNVAESAIAVASTTNDTSYNGVQLNVGDGSYASYPTTIPAAQSVNGATGTFGPADVVRVGDAGSGGTGGCSASDYTSVPDDSDPYIVIFDWNDGACGSNTRMTTAVDTLGYVGDGSGGQLAGILAVTPAEDAPFILLSCGYGTGKAPVACMSILREDGLNILANPSAFNATMDSTLKTTLSFSEGDQLSSFSSRGPRMDAETGLQILKPDLAAPGDFIFSTDVGSGTEGTTLGGTSMASPHVTGSAALMRELHPTWTVGQIKALLMNTAANDVWTQPDQTGSNYGVSRVGSGRVDLANAINTETVAYATNAPERVSVSFGLIEAVTAQTINQTITVRNLGATPRTYNVTFDQRNDTSMAAFSVSPSSINVPAGGSTTVTVTLTLDPTASQPHTPDATTDLIQSRLLASGPRHFVAEEGGYVVLTPTDTSSSLRVAVHAVPRPASNMAAADDTVTVSTAATGVTTIDLTGTDIFTGVNWPYDTLSMVTAFEKVYESPNDAFSPAGYDRGDLQYIGLASDLSYWLSENDGNLNAALADTTIYMALTVYGDWSTANAYETLFDIYFDTDGDQVEDLNLFNWDLGTAASAFGVADDPSDVFIGFWQDLNTSSVLDLLIPNEYLANTYDTYLLNNNVVVFPIPASDLGLTSADSNINFYVDVLGELNFTDSTRITTPGPYISYDIATAPFSFNDDSGLQGGPFPGMPWYPDFDGLYIPVDYDLSSTTTPPEILLLHHHNASGNRVEVLTMDISGEADLEAGINASEETPAEGAIMATMAEATNNGPAPAEGVVIEHTLPIGLTYTGDDCPTVSSVTGGSGSPTVITCDYGKTVVPPNFLLTLQVASTVDAGTEGRDLVITTDVSYSATSGNTETDTSNNTAARRICVGGNIETCNVTPVKSGSSGGETIGDFVVPNMLFAITPMNVFAQPGDSVEWKVSINNTTGAAINDASINLTLPGNISIQSATSTSGTVSTGTQLADARYTMGPLGQPRSFSQSAQQNVVQFAQDVIQAGEQVIITINTLIPTNYSQSSVVMNGTLYGNGTTLATTSGTLSLVSQLPATGDAPWSQEIVAIALLMAGAALIFGMGGAYRKRRA